MFVHLCSSVAVCVHCSFFTHSGIQPLPPTTKAEGLLPVQGNCCRGLWPHWLTWETRLVQESGRSCGLGWPFHQGDSRQTWSYSSTGKLILLLVTVGFTPRWPVSCAEASMKCCIEPTIYCWLNFILHKILLQALSNILLQSRPSSGTPILLLGWGTAVCTGQHLIHFLSSCWASELDHACRDRCVIPLLIHLCFVCLFIISALCAVKELLGLYDTDQVF